METPTRRLEVSARHRPESMHRLAWIITVLVILTLVGVGWFRLVEGWSLLDSAYMTVITLSTVGYDEVRPLSASGRIFVMVYLVCGLGVFLFAVVQLGEMIVRAELGTWLRRRGMNTMLKSVENHFIICGFGRMGRTICRHLADRKLPFVVIRRADGEIVLPPTAATVIRPDDVLIALGKVTAVSQFLSSEQLTS